MGKAQALDVIHQLFGQFAIIQKFTLCITLPGTQVHFIDADRVMQPVLFFAACKPLRILPLIIGRGDAGTGARAHLAGLGIGVKLLHDAAGIAMADFKFVQGVRIQTGNE